MSFDALLAKHGPNIGLILRLFPLYHVSGLCLTAFYGCCFQGRGQHVTTVLVLVLILRSVNCAAYFVTCAVVVVYHVAEVASRVGLTHERDILFDKIGCEI